jgi:hypothetical protein
MTASESRRPSQRQGTAADQEYPASPLVYLSYRQEDEPYARRLNADLEWRLGKGVVLSGPVSLGFATQLDQQFREMLDPIDVLLLMLGPASPGDRVPPAQALEIASALAQGCQIVPVLVGGPRPSTDLPRALNEATKLRAVMLEDDSWDRDLSRLENAIQRAAAQRPLPRPGLAAGPVELLPEETRSFVNRERELKDLLDWFEDRMSKPGEEPPPVALITGQGGIGKSALAVRTAHQLRTRFPDGRLYASLGEAGARAEVLNQFLEAFGLDRRDLPESVEGLAELYQGILAGRRVLVVLDDIQAAGREGLLLPRAPGCGALLVSRSREIRADHILDLDTGLAERDALELLRQSAGPSFVDSNPELATELVRAVSGHPLTLQLVAAQARQSGASSLPWLAGLKALPDAQIRHLLLDRVYGRLPEVHRRLFRLLGVLPTPEFESGLAAALGGIDSDAANAALRSLVDNVLLEPGGDGRYRLGDLVGGFAAERLAADEPEEEQRAALERAIGWIAVRTAYEPQAPITRDYWTADDTLGYGQYAEAIAAFIRHQSTRPPLTIGVKGPWGAGKTSLMRMVQERLDPRANRKTWKPTPLELTSESRELLAPGRAPRPGVQVTNREVLRRATEPPPDADGPDAWQLDVHPPVTPRLQEEKDWRPTVWFNPWTYQSGEQIWAGLAYEIITQVTDRLATGDRERFWLALNLRRWRWRGCWPRLSSPRPRVACGPAPPGSSRWPGRRSE